MKIEHFDVNRIIGIEAFDRTRASYEWLPKKQKTWIFGIKRNAWHDEGWYSHGCYYDGYMEDSWDATPYTKKELIDRGYLVDEDGQVWNRPYVKVYLEADCNVSQNFNTLEEASEWVDQLKATSGKTFETVIHG